MFNGIYLGSQPTGLGVVTRSLAQELSSQKVVVLDPMATGLPNSLAIPNHLSPEQGCKGHLRRLLWTENQLPRLLRRTGASFLLSPVPEAPLLNKEVRSIVLAHDLIPLRFPKLGTSLLRFMTYVPLVLHTAERVLCNSEATAREVHRWLQVPQHKLVTIKLGCDHSNCRPLNLNRQPFFLVLGRHDYHKNLPRVLKAFAQLAEPDMALKLVGPFHRHLTPQLKQLATHLGIDRQC